MEFRQIFDVIVKDINGNVLYEFKNVVPVVKQETVTISDSKFIKNQVVVIECVAENLISGDVSNDE